MAHIQEDEDFLTTESKSELVFLSNIVEKVKDSLERCVKLL